MVTIVKATPEDAEDYANILNKSWKDTYGEYITYEHIDDEFNIEKLIKGFPEYIKNPDYDLYMIKQDGKNVGIVELGHYDEAYKEDMTGIGEIRTLHISKPYQGQGIGRTVLHFAFDELKKRGYTTICLWVKKQNSRAIAIYEKYGFFKTIYDCTETGDGAPSMIMEKILD